LTQVRIALSESRQDEQSLRTTVETLQSSLQTSRTLIQTLERDLEDRSNALEQMLQNQQTGGGGNNNRSAMQELEDLLDTNTINSMNNNLKNNGIANTNMPNSSGANAPNNPGEVNAQMISWLTSQRDKYKEKLQQSEATSLRLQQQVDNITSKYTNLENENVQLYSRIKYLQHKHLYNNSNNNNPSRLEEGRYADDEVEGKYSVLYEQRMNPFAEVCFHYNCFLLQTYYLYY
jgi:uncharacterized coiled-coil DUF342 family protein